VKNVVVACDFSAFSRRALALALQGYPFGGADEVSIDVVHVVDEDLYRDVLGSEHVPDDAAVTSYVEAEIGRARQALEDLGIEAGEGPSPRIVVERGRPYQKLLEHAERQQALGIMLGGQGHGGVGERLLGRTAQRVVRHAPGSVYVTRHFRNHAAPRRTLVAVDGSEGSRRALEVARALAQRTGGAFSTIRVVEAPYVPYLEVFAHEPEIEPYLEKAVDQGYDELVAFEREVLGELHSTKQSVFSGRVVESIEMQAEAQNAGTIVIGSHGRSGLARFLLGSVAEGLVTSSRIDVLVAR
jgi:nucleotide-binding universal stress UspA family protein